MRMMIKIVDIGASFLGLNDSSKALCAKNRDMAIHRIRGAKTIPRPVVNVSKRNWFPAAFFNLLTVEEDDIGPRTFEIKIGGSFPAAHIVTNLTKEENFVRSYRLIRSFGKAYPDNSSR